MIGHFSFFRFETEAISRRDLKEADDIGTGALSTVGNVIWAIFAGVWLGPGHVVGAVANSVTIIGVPFDIQHLKLAAIALAYIGKAVVTKEVATAARQSDAAAAVGGMRND